MTLLAIVLGCIAYLAAICFIPVRQVYAPGCAYIGLALLSMARTGGYPLLPVNNTMLFGWLCMTVVVMVATVMQPKSLRQSRRGMGFIMIGAFVGMALGLLGFTFASTPAVLYGIMIAGTAAGTFFGFLLFTSTPEGRPVGPGSGRFFTYLLAKGFPTAITVMQIGVVLVLVTALHRF